MRTSPEGITALKRNIIAGIIQVIIFFCAGSVIATIDCLSGSTW